MVIQVFQISIDFLKAGWLDKELKITRWSAVLRDIQWFMNELNM